MIDPSKVDHLTDPRQSRDPKMVAEGEERLQDMLLGIGVRDKTTTARWSHPAHPQGDIVWYLRSGGDVYQVEALPVPVVKGAGERTHRLWLNGNPMIGHQWCYSLEARSGGHTGPLSAT